MLRVTFIIRQFDYVEPLDNIKIIVYIAIELHYGRYMD